MTTPAVRVAPSPMSIGDVFSTTFSIFRRRAKTLLGLSALRMLASVLLVLVPLGIIIAQTFPWLGELGRRPGAVPDLRGSLMLLLVADVTILVLSIVAVLVQLYLDGLMIQVADQAVGQKAPTSDELRLLGRGVVGRLVGLYVLAMLATIVVLVICLLPAVILMGVSIGSRGTMSDSRAAATVLGSMGLSYLLMFVFSIVAVIFAVKLVYLIQIAAVERLGGFAALRRAWSLTKGAFWRTVGYLLVLGLVIGVAQQVAAMIGEVFLFPAMLSMGRTSNPQQDLLRLYTSPQFLTGLGVMYALLFVVQIVTRPIMLTYVTVMYRDQVQRRALGPVVPGRPPYGPPQGYGTPPAHGAPPGYGPPPGFPPSAGYGPPPR